MPAILKRARVPQKTTKAGRATQSRKDESRAVPPATKVKTAKRNISPKTTAKVDAQKSIAKTQLSKTKTRRTSKARAAISASEVKQSATITATKNKTETKARRVRAPKDLAVQYGEKTATRRKPATPQKERRARRDAAAKARLQELMSPDEQLLARLARAGMIASSLAPEGIEEDGQTGASRRSSTKSVRRPRKWESRCGKCGVLSIFKSAAGVCAKCGAIAVRD